MPNPLDPAEDMQRLVLPQGDATAKDGHAFHRQLQLAEPLDDGQVRRPALSITPACNSDAFAFDLHAVRAVDEAVSNDMLLCIDEMRRGQSVLH